MTAGSGEVVDAQLSASGVRKSYGGAPALVDFSLELACGEVHGLLGSNGSGKSTALHVITGLVDADAGVVMHRGRDVRNETSRSSFGFAPDDLALPAALTGQEFLSLHHALRRRPDDSRARELSDLLGLSEALDKPLGSYSHGMKRQLQLVTALMHEPSLLVLDEPFRGLDPDAGFLLEVLLRELVQNGAAVLMATHDLAQASQHCDSVSVLHRGRTAMTGNLREIEDEHGGLRAAFLAATGLEQVLAERREQIAGLFRKKATK